MITFILNKLARDKTPERMEKMGITCQYTTVADQELLLSLQNKLIEETLEVTEAQNKKEVIAELADVAEVIDAIKKYYAITDQEISAEKKMRHDLRGGFEKGVFIHSISMADDNERVAYFKAAPKKYPEAP